MADGDVLTIVSGHQAFAPAAGGVQTISLLGPFPIQFDDAALFSSEMELTPLTNGTIVLRAWAIVSARFETAGGPLSSQDLKLSIGVGSAATGTYVVQADTNLAEREGPGVAYATGEAVGTPYPVGGSSIVHVTDDGQFLCADMVNFGAALAQGAADIYALIATPA